MLDFSKQNEKDKRFCNEEIYEEVSEELGVNIDLVREVFKAHSDFARQTIEVGAFENIILPYLGKLKSKPRQVQQVMGKINRP